MINGKSTMIINPETVPPIHIIGVGGTGSYVALILAKLGIENITIYDFDTVEMKNVGNQMFGIQDVGILKTVALHKRILIDTGIDINIKSIKVDLANAKFKGIVFVLTDTMLSRKQILKANKTNFDCELLIETRLGIFESRVYCLDPKLPAIVRKYQETLCDDTTDTGEELVSECGIRQDLGASSMLLASFAIMRLINFIDLSLGKKDVFETVNEIGRAHV